MASKEDIAIALELFHKHRPEKAFDEIKKSDMGLMAVIKFLNENPGDKTSVDISKYLNISSARMAVLLKKLEAKDLIIKLNSQNDARSKIIKLSEKGKAFAEARKTNMYSIAEKVIDEFGLDELKKLFENIEKLQKIIFTCDKHKMEEIND